jgi:Tfp pilus assembly protein PilF
MRRGWMISWFLLFVGSACRAPAPLNPRAIQHQRSGVELLAKGDFDAAQAQLELALEYNPHYAQAINGLGLLAYRRGRFPQATQKFRQAIAVDPDFAEGRNNLGVMLLKAARYRDSAQAFRAALAIDPGYVDARFNLALSQIQLGQMDHAVHDLTKVVASAPKWVAARAELACALVIADRKVAADKHLRIGFRLAKRNVDLIRCNGQLLRKAGALPQAETTLKRAVQLDPGDGTALFELVVTLSLAKKFAEANALLQKLLIRSPHFPEAHFTMGYLLAQLKRKAEAVTALRRALNFRADYPAAHLLLADLLTAQGDRKQAKRHYAAFVKRVPAQLVFERGRAKRWLAGARN